MKKRYPLTVELLTQELEYKKDFLIKKGFNVSSLVRNYLIQLYEREKSNSYKI